MQVYVPVRVYQFMCLFGCAGSCACWVYKVMCLFGYAGSCACWCIQVYEPVVVCLFGCTGPCACWSMLIAGVCTCWGVQGHVPVLVCRFMCLLCMQVYVPVGVYKVTYLFGCTGSCACWCMYLLGCTRSCACLRVQVQQTARYTAGAQRQEPRLPSCPATTQAPSRTCSSTPST